MTLSLIPVINTCLILIYATNNDISICVIYIRNNEINTSIIYVRKLIN